MSNSILGWMFEKSTELVPYENKYYLSTEPLGALSIAQGSFVHRVRCSGEITKNNNYAVFSQCTTVSGGINVRETLHHFARLCALDVIHLWDAPRSIIHYLRTGEDNISKEDRQAAFWTMEKPWGLEKVAAIATMNAITYGCEYNVHNRAADASLHARYTVTGEANRDTLTAKHNRRLYRMLLTAIKNQDVSTGIVSIQTRNQDVST